MTAAAHRDEEVLLAREAHRRDDVGHAARPHDERRVTIDHPVPDDARSVVPGIAGENDLAVEGLAERGERGRVDGTADRRSLPSHGRARIVPGGCRPCQSGPLPRWAGSTPGCPYDRSLERSGRTIEAVVEALPLIVLAALFAVGLWVYRDASTHEAQGRPVVVTLGPLRIDRPAVWFVACLILSVLFIPIYLSVRTP